MRITGINNNVNFKATFIPLNKSADFGDEFYQIMTKKASVFGKPNSIVKMEELTPPNLPKKSAIAFPERVVNLSYFENEQEVPSVMVRVTDFNKTFGEFKDAISNALSTLTRHS